MQTPNYLFAILATLLLFTIQSSAQKSEFSHYTIEVIGETNQLTEMMNNNYSKEFYTTNVGSYYVSIQDHQTEIIQYDSNKIPTKYYIIKNDSLFVNSTYEYVDNNAGELSAEELIQIEDYYQINRDVKKAIYGFDCFQVIMQDPSGGDTNIEMFVTESLPNFPIHSPLYSGILNAEPLEINMNLMGNTIKIEIVNQRKGLSIEEDLKIDFSEAIPISDPSYIKMTTL